MPSAQRTVAKEDFKSTTICFGVTLFKRGWNHSGRFCNTYCHILLLLKLIIYSLHTFSIVSDSQFHLWEIKACFTPLLHIQAAASQLLSRVRIFATLWTIAGWAPLSMEFSRQEYWCRLPFPSPGDLSDPCILCLLHRQADSLPLSHLGSPFHIQGWVSIKGSLTLNLITVMSAPFR